MQINSKKQNFLKILSCFLWLLLPTSSFASSPLVPYFQPEKSSYKVMATGINGDKDKINSLHFLTSVDFPVFSQFNKDGYLMGYNIDLMRALCSELNIEENHCVIEAVPFDDLVPYLLEDKADAVVAGVKPWPIFSKLSFTSPYLKFPGRFITLKKNHFEHFDRKKLRGKKIGVLANSLHEKAVNQYFSDTTIETYPDAYHLQQALFKGKIFAIFADGLSLSLFLKSDIGKKCCRFSGGPYEVDPFGLRIAYAKKNVKLGQVLDQALKSLEQKGVFKELYMRYFPVGFY